MADRPRTDPSTALLERLAHDLRGPLSPMQTATWLLRKGGLADDKRDELLDVLDRQSNRLSDMVQEISDWVRARDGRLLARREAVPVPLFLDLVAATTTGAPDWEQGPGLETGTLHGDVQRLVQMLSTMAGFLHARGGLAQWRAEAGEGTLALTLEAAGTWDEGEQELVLSAPHPSPHDGGLGMGLLISKEIARAHGGSVDAGRSGQGNAKLAVTLPVARQD